jgi:hypothetical protein
VVDNSHASFSLSKIIRFIKLPRSIYFPTIWSEIFGNSNLALTHISRNYFPSLTAFLKIRDKSENIRRKKTSYQLHPAAIEFQSPSNSEKWN